MGTKKCVKWGFGHGESEHEVSFSLASRNGAVSLFGPETTVRFNSPEPGPGTEPRFKLPAKFGLSRSKLGVPGHIFLEIKGQRLNFLLANGDFFDEVLLIVKSAD